MTPAELAENWGRWLPAIRRSISGDREMRADIEQGVAVAVGVGVNDLFE